MRRTSVAYAAVVALVVFCSMETMSKAEPIVGAGGGSTAASEQQKEVVDAAARFKDRDIPGALKLLKEAEDKNPDMPPAHLWLAQWFSQTNNPAETRRALEQTVMVSPNDPEVYVIMGSIAIREGRVTEADMLLRKASDLIAKFTKSKKRKDILMPQILAGLAAVDQARENWSGAQKQFEAWLKLEPKNTAAMEGLSRCMFQQKNPKGSLEMLKAAKKEDSNVLTPEAILAQYYEQSGDHENAKKWMSKALEEAPKDLKTRLIVGQWAVQTNQLDEAKKEAAAALQIDPKSLDAKVLSGVLALFDKDYTTAERYFEAAHLQSPRTFAASNNLALALIEQKDETKKRRALEFAESNVEQYPKSAEAASTYGWILYKLGRLEDAERAFNAAISGGSFTPDTAYYIARLSYERGREAQAKQWIDIALKSNAPFVMRPEAKALLEQLKK